jgi:hypothetical protein
MRITTGQDIAPFSNDSPTITAPGIEVLSADAMAAANEPVVNGGTSMASPLEAGRRRSDGAPLHQL